PLAARRPEAVDAPGGERALAEDLLELLLCVVVELARGRLLEDRRELALQLPGVEEELPVDVAHELRRLDGALPDAGEGRDREVVEGDAVTVRARGFERQQRLAVTFGVLLAQPVLELAVLQVERRTP